MSITGTLASLAGGLFMGLTLTASLLLESSACRARWFHVIVPLAAWGTAAGGLGSLVSSLCQATQSCFVLISLQLDSFMGATIQRTRYSNTSKRILTDESTEPSRDADIKVVSGLNILTNNQVGPDSSATRALRLT